MTPTIPPKVEVPVPVNPHSSSLRANAYAISFAMSSPRFTIASSLSSLLAVVSTINFCATRFTWSKTCSDSVPGEASPTA